MKQIRLFDPSPKKYVVNFMEVQYLTSIQLFLPLRGTLIKSTHKRTRRSTREFCLFALTFISGEREFLFTA